MLAPALAEGAEERLERGAKIAHDLLRPGMLEVLPRKCRQPHVVALAGEHDAVDGRYVEEAHELLVDAIGLGIGGHGHHARNGREDRRLPQIAQNGNALVALLHVEALHELIDDDGVAYALSALRVDEVAPLHREL